MVVANSWELPVRRRLGWVDETCFTTAAKDGWFFGVLGGWTRIIPMNLEEIILETTFCKTVTIPGVKVLRIFWGDGWFVFFFSDFFLLLDEVDAIVDWKRKVGEGKYTMKVDGTIHTDDFHKQNNKPHTNTVLPNLAIRWWSCTLKELTGFHLWKDEGHLSHIQRKMTLIFEKLVFWSYPILHFCTVGKGQVITRTSPNWEQTILVTSLHTTILYLRYIGGILRYIS